MAARPWYKIDPNDKIALPILFRELGILKTLLVGMRVQNRVKNGHPFHELPAPDCEQERLSREQIGPAIVLYQELLTQLEQPHALHVAEQVIIACAQYFLKESIGKLQRSELDKLDAAGKKEFVSERSERFFNATLTWNSIDSTEVSFTVTHCRFPPLCRELGVPELAPSFCKGDAHYFGSIEPDVVLERPHTIAEGASECPFTLRWTGE